MRKTFEIPIPEEKLNQAVMQGIQEGQKRRGKTRQRSSGGWWSSLLTAAVIALLLLLSHFMTPDVLQKLLGTQEDIPQQRVGAEGEFEPTELQEIPEEDPSASSAYNEDLAIELTVTDVYCCEDTFLLELELVSKESLKSQLPYLRNLLVSAHVGWEEGSGYGNVETLLTGRLVDEHTFRGVMSLPEDYAAQRISGGTGDGEMNLGLYVEELIAVEGLGGQSLIYVRQWTGDWKMNVPVSLQESVTRSYNLDILQAAGEWIWTPLGMRGILTEQPPTDQLVLFLDDSGRYLGTFQAGDQWEEWIPLEDREVLAIYMYLLPQEEQEDLQRLLEQTNGGQSEDFADGIKELSVSAVMPVYGEQQEWDES